MRQKSLIGCILISLLVISLSSCTIGAKSPTDTVKHYLDEMMIIKDSLYKEAARDQLKGDPEKAKRYTEAGQTVKELMWTDLSSLKPDRRKKLLMTLGTIVTFKSYNVLSERIEGDKAYVEVVFGETSIFEKDLGEASRRDSKPTTYELIKTREGWRLKDVNGLLARAGM